MKKNNFEVENWFGKKIEIIKKQENRFHFLDIPVGTKAFVIKKVDLPEYDLLVAFDFQPQIITIGSGHEIEYYEGFVNRETWKII